MKHDVAAKIGKALGELARRRGLEGAIALPSIDRPKKPEHGDFATNVAMTLAKRAGAKPIELATELQASLRADPTFERVDIAGPGFLNLKLAPRAFHEALVRVLEAGATYGRAPAATGERINLEFVSANPTGPLHVAHGRSSVVGDVIARLLEARGHRVVREYYVNDAGNQVKLLADSVIAKITGGADPEGGYGLNAYVLDLAEWAKVHLAKIVERAATGDRGAVDELGRKCVAAILGGFSTQSTKFVGIRGTLRALGIFHDVWFSEGALHADGKVERAIEVLRKGDWLKNEGEAVLFQSTRLGDDKDRVVFKSDGGHTYFASDIAYHQDKLDRGFDRLIDVWGADHHGYIQRLTHAITALGLPKERFEVILVQMVSLLKDGQPYKMGKRLGNFITIDEILEEIDAATGREGSGRDALRYYFSARRTDAQIEIDVELAKKESLDNPVYYLQYGHARLCAILRKGEEECGIAIASGVPALEELAPLVHPDELSIVALLSEWPDVLAEAAKGREPHRIVAYLTSLAQSFQSYYTRLKNDNDTILPRTGERQDGSWRTRDGGAFATKVRARLAWVRAIREVYAAGLALLGIHAPQRLERASAIAGAPGAELDPALAVGDATSLGNDDGLTSAAIAGIPNGSGT